MRHIFAICASTAIVLLAPATVSAAYLTPAPACTTKDAQKPNINAQRPNPNPNWWIGTPQTQMTTRMPAGSSPNDFPMLQTFPTVYTQPVDKSKDGPKVLPVSTCP